MSCPWPDWWADTDDHRIVLTAGDERISLPCQIGIERDRLVSQLNEMSQRIGSRGSEAEVPAALREMLADPQAES